MHYPDKWLRLIGIPFLAIFIRHIGDPTPLYDLLQKADYYYDLLAGLIITAIVWETNRYIIRYFDRRYSWINDTFQRFALQALTNLGLTTLILVATIMLYNYVIMQRGPAYNIHYLFVIDVPLGLVFITLINLIYTTMNIVHTYEAQLRDVREQLARARQHPGGEAEPERVNKKNLVVSKGSAMVPLPIEEIAYIYKVNDYSFVKTFDNQEYLADDTLDQLNQMLSESDFYRVNRQMIASIESIKQVQNKEQGGFFLLLSPPFAGEVTVSKKKAAEFRAWMAR
jgi:ABC-type multidrug transport system fused ATPase/permease subunit